MGISMIDLDTMTNEELIAGLMRGDRAELRLGYDPAAAISALSAVRELSAEELIACKSYARGFAKGMTEPRELIYPAAVRD